MSVLSIQQLSKNYGAVKAVKSLSLEIPRGSVYGILGPNGSGKSTTLGMVLGITNPSAGSFSWFGERNSHVQRQKIGTMLESPNFYPYLNSVQNLRITCGVKKVPYSDIDRVLDIVGLAARKKSKVSTYSLGMKQRLAVANALIGDPEVLVLDEPTNGLDPQGIAEMRQIIIDLGQQGKTILLASHILDEVEKTCSHVAILKFGELLQNGPVSALLDGEITIILKGGVDHFVLVKALEDHPLVKVVKEVKGRVEVQVDQEVSSQQINRFLGEQGIFVAEIYPQGNTLESEFLKITK